MTLSTRESKALLNLANSMEKVVRLLETHNINILAIHERLMELNSTARKQHKIMERFLDETDVDLDKLAENVQKLKDIKADTEDVVRDANQLELPTIVVPNEDGSTTFTKHPEDLG